MRNKIDAFRASKGAQSQEGGVTGRAAADSSGSSNTNMTVTRSRAGSKDFGSSTDFSTTDYPASGDIMQRLSARSDTDPRRIMDEYAPATSSADALLSTQKVSSLKSLRSSNPEILEKWRAKRAASYVVTQKHPLEPPTQRELTSKPFKPSGSLSTDSAGEAVVVPRASGKSGNSKRRGTGDGPLESSRMRGSLGPLLDALKKTEADIERQELKIALNKAKK